MTLNDKSKIHSGVNLYRKRSRIFYWIVAVLVLVIAGTLLGVMYERNVRKNFRCVVPDKVYRSSQPSARNIENWAKKYGLKTVINLRGLSDSGKICDAREKATQLGLSYIDIELSGRHAPTRPDLIRLIELIETVNKPMLLHCLSGVDRSGMAGVIVSMAIGGEPYEKAAGELFNRFQYIRGRRDKSVGALFAAYEEYHNAEGTETGGWKEFRRWVLEIYYPYYYHVSITPPSELMMTSTQTLDVPLIITNLSNRAIPFGDENRRFRVKAFLGTSVNQKPDKSLGHSVWFDRDDLAPGETIEILYRLPAPGPHGSYNVGFDMIEEDYTWFARQGSPIGRSHVVVTNPKDCSTGQGEPEIRYSFDKQVILEIK